MDFARAPADIMEATVTDVETGKEMTMPKKVVVTYISRQDVRRHLIQEDHELLVQSLQELVQRKNSDWVSGGTENGREWELNIIKPETMTKDEQVAVASRTTVSPCTSICDRTAHLIYRSSLAYTETDLPT